MSTLPIQDSQKMLEMSNEELGALLRSHLASLPIEVHADKDSKVKLYGEREKLLEVPEKSSWDFANIFALMTWATRYRNWDQNTGESLETIPEETFIRVAEELAWVERKFDENADVKARAQEFFQVMMRKEFVPAGRTLADAGTGRKTVSNCVVLEFGDRLLEGKDSILNTLIEAVKLQCQGCGLGFAWHLLRPYLSDVITKRTQSSGIVSYLQLFAAVFSTIKQTNSRNGANMGMCGIWHPEVLEFVRAKDTEGGNTAVFNISVLFTDEFMECATNPSHPNYEKPWMCHFEMPVRNPNGVGTLLDADGKEVLQRIEELPFFVVRPTDIFKNKRGKSTTTWGNLPLKAGDKYYPKWTASEILTHIAKHAWINGEPGFGFWDEIQRTNPLPLLGLLQACNPCGEQFLHDGDVCNLGSIDLSSFVRIVNGAIFFDWDRLREVTRTAMRMLDNVIEITEFESERVQTRIHENRRVGLGIMGLGDAFLSMRIVYGSDESIEFSREVMRVITEEARAESKRLAMERGSFPNIHLSVFAKDEPWMRNAACTTVAPTGTISAFFGTSNGCEPRFCPGYTYDSVLKLDKKRSSYVVDAMRAYCRRSEIPKMAQMADDIDFNMRIGPHPEFERWMNEVGVDVHLSLEKLADQLIVDENERQEFISQTTNGKGPVTASTSLYDAIMYTGQMDSFAALISEDIRKVYRPSVDITPLEHIKIQAALQENTDNSISKTIQVHNEASVEEVRDTIVDMWKFELKGGTVYRDGSREVQVLNQGSGRDENEGLPHHPARHTRFQDLIERASVDEYRTIFEGAADEMMQVEMTPEELAIALRSVITHRSLSAPEIATDFFDRQLSALEEGLRNASLSASSEDDDASAASSSSSSTPTRLINSLRMSANGTPMCTRAGCDEE